MASFGIVGAIVATRLPRNAIGWILWASGTFMGWSVAANTYANESLERYAGTLPGTVAVAWLSSVGIIPILCVTAIFVPLLFPDGHLPSPGWRWVAWFAGMAIGLTTFINAIAPGTMSNGVAIQNPTAIPGLGPLPEVLGIAVVGSLAVSFVLAVGSVVWRYRRGTSIERQQTRWFASSAVVTLVTVGLGFSGIGPLADGGWLLVLAGLALMPIAIGVAILRYRLYELDRLVSRTISYGLLTGALLAAYAGLILVLQGALGAVTERKHACRRAVHLDRRCPLPADPTAAPAHRRSPIRPGALRRRTNDRRVRGATTRGGGPGRAVGRARLDGRQGGRTLDGRSLAATPRPPLIQSLRYAGRRRRRGRGVTAGRLELAPQPHTEHEGPDRPGRAAQAVRTNSMSTIATWTSASKSSTTPDPSRSEVAARLSPSAPSESAFAAERIAAGGQAVGDRR